MGRSRQSRRWRPDSSIPSLGSSWRATKPSTMEPSLALDTACRTRGGQGTTTGPGEGTHCRNEVPIDSEDLHLALRRPFNRSNCNKRRPLHDRKDGERGSMNGLRYIFVSMLKVCIGD